MKRVGATRSINFALALLVGWFFSISPLHALSPDPATAKITFTFDDARASTYTKAAPILAANGLKGLLYATTGCVGMTKTPNTCHAANDVSYMTWAQVTDIQNTYKWEVGSHSVTHPYMVSTNSADGQPKKLTATQLENEISQSKLDLAKHGINARSFASPYGDYNMESLRLIAKYYDSHRGFKDQNNNVYPYNDRLINDLQVQNPVTLVTVKAKVDEAIAKKYWLVLTFHDIKDTASTDPNQYHWSTANFTALANYVKTKVAAQSIKNLNVSEALVSGTSNLLPPLVVGSRLGAGWTTDKTTSYTPSTTATVYTSETSTSVRVTGTTTSTHLFSPSVNVNSSQVYVLKTYLSMQAITKGEIGFYIDEYDTNGNWISGQYKTRENSIYIENVNVIYQPTSPSVKTAKLQLYTTAGSDLKAVIDHLQWYAVAGTANASSIIPNGEFDTGIANGWSTDDTASIKADTANHGSGSTSRTSVAFAKTSGTAHLFSPLVAVDASKSYYMEQYLNITANSGSEVGLYIDEYDISGNWISGQYKATYTALGASTPGMTYKPTSTAVRQIRVQYIFAANGTLNGYIDHVSCIPF